MIEELLINLKLHFIYEFMCIIIFSQRTQKTSLQMQSKISYQVACAITDYIHMLFYNIFCEKVVFKTLNFSKIVQLNVTIIKFVCEVKKRSVPM